LAAPIVPDERSDPAEQRCLDCAPSSSGLAIESTVPAPSFEPFTSFALPADLHAAPARTYGAIRLSCFRPPPPTLLRLHTMLTT
jgi:hypothetical protein